MASVEYARNKPARSALVFPNPISRSGATLQLENFAGSALQPQLMNLQGKINWQQAMIPPSAYFELPLAWPPLAKGMYILQIADNYGQHRMKIMVE